MRPSRSMSRRLLRNGLLAALSVSLFPLFALPAAQAIPVVIPAGADPSVIRGDDGLFYAFVTSDDWGDGKGMHNVAMFTSFDLVDWMFAGDAFDSRPGWHGDKGTWAPDVVAEDNGYAMYYSLGDDVNPCIGKASAPELIGPWTDLGRAVFCAKDVGIGGTIDPAVWDDGTTKTMYVGNFRGIYAIELNSDGTAPEGDPVQVADDRFEAPYIYERDGYYYLFVSAGNCCNGQRSAYRVLAGRSDSLTGPFLDRKGQDLNEGGGALVLAGSEQWGGPGHNTVVPDDAGDDWMVYHAIPRSSITLPSGAPNRKGMIDKITWVDGWPEVGDGSPTSTAPEVPLFDLPVHVSYAEKGVKGDIASGGDEFDVVVRIEAPADKAYSGNVWLQASMPDYSMTDPLTEPIAVDLEPGEVIEETLTYKVPGNSSQGIYRLFACAGPTTDEIVEYAAHVRVKPGGEETD
ncbi:family 43 glycosylhydrolase [Antrihabitans sp. NCIMB 15449]|uniref:Family 43 glycosylhydrolase n=1 Tax=Antrihabitans spumae TaxID=3373370 RepID=A0ABW7JRW3_9NOCA